MEQQKSLKQDCDVRYDRNTHNLIQEINFALCDDNISEAYAAVREYIQPLLKAVKSCAIFEDDKAKRDILIETIRKYEPNFLL